MKKSYITPEFTITSVALTEFIAVSVGFGGEEGTTINNSADILIRGEEIVLPSFGGQEEW